MLNKKNIIALLITGLFIAAPAFADKPAWAGGGDGDKVGQSQPDRGHGKADKRHDKHNSRDFSRQDDKRSNGGHDRRDRNSSVHVRFSDQQRVYLHDYYREEFRGGRCPPGLAKKHNGCMPPGQAKKWRVGYPLGGIAYYELPPQVLVRIGPAPVGYRYVRVAGDILMIAVGTSLVVDAIADLSGR